MSRNTRALLLDGSTTEEFRFSLCCAQCGEAWHSRPERFSKAGITPETGGKQVVFNVLYQREREKARNRAAEEAAVNFNTCPICRRMVCDHCFMICDDLDMCQSCAERLQEKGELVLTRGNAG